MTNKSTKILLAASMISAALMGCGGGGGSSSDSSSASIAGKAIDGYIIGATVYLDLNFNGQMESNEPSVVTVEEGEFELIVPSNIAKCAEYVPVVVDVPVGAIDTDEPDTPIDEAYQMTISPKFALTTDSDLLNLTPLTSLVWTEVEQELRNSSDGQLSCDSLLKGEALKQDIIQRLKAQEIRVAERYNVTVEELYSDYIALGGEAGNKLHDMAKKLVPGLKKSYSETKEFIDANPDADFAWVEYFFGKWATDDSYEDEWYRREFIQVANGDYDAEIYQVSSDLDEKVRLFSKDSGKRRVRGSIETNTVLGMTVNGDQPGYLCALAEQLEVMNSTGQYGIVNKVYLNVQDWDECKNAKFSTDSPGSHITQSVLSMRYDSNPNSDNFTSSEHVYDKDHTSGFEYLIGNTDTVTADELVAIADRISTDFYNAYDYGASYWNRSRNEFGDDPKQIMTNHDIDGNWTQATFYKNGTHTNLCGNSEETMTESGCEFNEG
ncbi:hypothetical protein QWY97_13590 [Vibrio cortegadensis]|uniref:hypothetical protein n=1 Tax=Vibrio cortegadensis TaxID=1328770 RepID=UPI0021C34F3B|nr:hypothetical protein [Vibrio cortegadensis]MDN3698370.1 hypothetical protein [Vibrio cortegadensis]